MGKTILTSKQLNFLELVQQDKQITKRFYFTGGTALAEFYLHHRLSEDIDLFTQEEEIDQLVVLSFLKKISNKLGVVKIDQGRVMGLYSFFLYFKDGDMLKVDFNYYPFPRIGKSMKFKNLDVDSLHDIAVNKLQAISTRTKGRDYVDLYFILKSNDFSVERLMLDARAKFDWYVSNDKLINMFAKVVDIENADLPKMLVPFDRKKMEQFFLGEAKKLKKEILK